MEYFEFWHATIERIHVICCTCHTPVLVWCRVRRCTCVLRIVSAPLCNMHESKSNDFFGTYCLRTQYFFLLRAIIAKTVSVWSAVEIPSIQANPISAGGLLWSSSKQCAVLWRKRQPYVSEKASILLCLNVETISTRYGGVSYFSGTKLKSLKVIYLL